MSPESPPPRVGLSLLKSALLAGIVIVLCTAGAVSAAGVLQVQSLKDELIGDGRQQIDVPEVTRAQAGGPRTLLLLGADTRYGDSRSESRSDTMLLVRIDPDEEAIRVMSIPRDLQTRVRTRRGATVTDKINRGYAEFGPRGSVQEIKRVFARADRDLEINNVVNVNFGAFRRGVDYIGGVYVDVDRDYFNDNSRPGDNYATIDVNPGYQLLRGRDSLDYVRYRHGDNDFVRASRQQDYLRQLKAQAGVGKLIEDGITRELSTIFKRYVQVDRSLRSTQEIFSLLKLATFAREKPVRQVTFEITRDDLTYVYTSAPALRRTYAAFMGETRPAVRPGGSAGSARRSTTPRRRSSSPARASSVPTTLVGARNQGEEQAIGAARRARFPFYFPTLIRRNTEYVGDKPRVYPIRDEQGRLRRAYRMVFRRTDQLSPDYYGVQGLTWKDPPILDGGEAIRRGGRTLRVYYDGADVRLVAWRTPQGVYWVSNSLTRYLKPREMIAIAASFRRLGQR